MNNETETALLELEHRYGKEVRDRVEQMGFVITKHGHWIKHKDGYYRCSECGSRGSAIKAHYCHHCGARMEGE